MADRDYTESDRLALTELPPGLGALHLIAVPAMGAITPHDVIQHMQNMAFEQHVRMVEAMRQRQLAVGHDLPYHQGRKRPASQDPELSRQRRKECNRASALRKREAALADYEAYKKEVFEGKLGDREKRRCLSCTRNLALNMFSGQFERSCNLCKQKVVNWQKKKKAREAIEVVEEPASASEPVLHTTADTTTLDEVAASVYAVGLLPHAAVIHPHPDLHHHHHHHHHMVVHAFQPVLPPPQEMLEAAQHAAEDPESIIARHFSGLG
jgi:hypothetical protein